MHSWVTSRLPCKSSCRLKPLFEKLSRSFMTFQIKFVEEVEPRLGILRLYAEGDATKREMAEELTSEEFNNTLKELYTLADTFITDATSLHRTVYDIAFRLQEAFTNLFDLTLPILDDQTTESTKVWQLLLSMTNNTEVEVLKQMYTDSRKEVFNQMLRNMFEPFWTYPQEVKASVQNAVKGLRLAFHRAPRKPGFVHGGLSDEL